MVNVLRFKDEPEPKYDYKAGRQIFDKEKSRDDKNIWAFVPPDTVNPIDIRLRQLAIELPNGPVDLKKIFYNLNIVIIHNEGMQLKFIKGKIKDIYMTTRDVYVKTRQGKIYVVPFEKSFELSEREV